MVYTTNCWICKQPWVFHDEDTKEPPLCDNCQQIWNFTKVVEDIMYRRPLIREDDDEEEEDDEDD